jgi:hypothetical protein
MKKLENKTVFITGTAIEIDGGYLKIRFWSQEL